MPGVLRAVLFDFNGILVDDEPIHFQLFQRVLGEEGVDLSEAEYYRSYLGFDDRGCLAAALEAAGQAASPARLARLIARKASYYRERIRREGYRLFPGALDLVRGLNESGVALGLVSGALREEIEEALRQAGVGELFKTIVAAEDVVESKPDPQGYLLALERLNSEPPLPDRLYHPHELLAIEDSPAGLEAARSAGIGTLGVAHTYPSAELDMADWVVERLSDVSPDTLFRFLS